MGEVEREAIRSRHELYRLVLENVSDLIALAAADGRILYASPSHERLLGWTPDELVGFDAVARIHPDDAERVLARIAHALETGTAVVEPVRFSRRDGAWVQLESTLTAVIDDETGERLLLAASRDVTAERDATEALRRSHDLLEAVLSAVGDAVTVISGDGRFVYANEPASALVGYASAEELLAAPLDEVMARFELLGPDGAPIPVERLPTRRVLAGESVVEEDVVYRVRATGEVRRSVVRAVGVGGGDGGPRLAINVFQDVTTERRAETDRRRLERVTEAALAYLSLDELLDELLQRVAELLEADTAAIFLVDETGGSLEVVATTGLEQGHTAWRKVPLGSGFAGRVAQAKESMIVADARDIELVNPVLHDRGVRSLIGAPLLVEGRVTGVLRAGAAEVGRFGADDLLVLQPAADRMALAIEQARLYQEARDARARLELLAEASDVLAASLDVEELLHGFARLIVPRRADLCAVHLLRDDGAIEVVGAAHVDPERERWLWEHQRAHPYELGQTAAIPEAIRSGRSFLFPEVTADRIDRLVAERPDHEELLRLLLGSSAITAPLAARGRTFGALTLVSQGRRYDQQDLALVEELARRAAVAVDNARLYRESEERGRVARILESVGDGVFLVDETHCIRYWNESAAAITGLAAADVLDRPAQEVLPGWAAVGALVPVGGAPQSMPLQLGRGETWISISGVALEEGTVYAFRDLTEERALEELRADFVSTVSHELRTPLAAIYGAAMTLRRGDVVLDETQRDDLLAVIGAESDRLARTVNDILWASRLDSGTMRVAIETCDGARLVESVVAAQRTHLPPAIELTLDVETGLPEIAADADKVRQVLVNLVDNAVKYSPDGGRVSVRAARSREAHVRFAVADEGLGIPYADQRRVFEKFYRLDPQLTRGVGGTGLGLYISRELARRMNGRIWVQSTPGRGSTFFVELPVAGGDADLRV